MVTNRTRDLQHILDTGNFYLVEVLPLKTEDELVAILERLMNQKDRQIRLKKPYAEIQKDIDVVNAYMELKMMKHRVQDSPEADKDEGGFSLV